MYQVAYCPYCGRERTMISISPKTGEIEWLPCSVPHCRGGFHFLITDSSGFIVFPLDVKGKYAFAKKYNVRG